LKQKKPSNKLTLLNAEDVNMEENYHVGLHSQLNKLIEMNLKFNKKKKKLSENNLFVSIQNFLMI
jgi:hypothetical protein